MREAERLGCYSRIACREGVAVEDGIVGEDNEVEWGGCDIELVVILSVCLGRESEEDEVGREHREETTLNVRIGKQRE
jgi:hypothetical protein